MKGTRHKKWGVLMHLSWTIIDENSQIFPLTNGYWLDPFLCWVPKSLFFTPPVEGYGPRPRLPAPVRLSGKARVSWGVHLLSILKSKNPRRIRIFVLIEADPRSCLDLMREGLVLTQVEFVYNFEMEIFSGSGTGHRIGCHEFINMFYLSRRTLFRISISHSVST